MKTFLIKITKNKKWIMNKINKNKYLLINILMNNLPLKLLLNQAHINLLKGIIYKQSMFY